MAAAVVLLAAAVLLHLGTPHHLTATAAAVTATANAESATANAESATANAVTAAVVAEPPAHTVLHGDALGAPHHEADDDALVLPPRAGHPAGTPVLAADVTADAALASATAVPPGPAHPRTAREVRSPGSGLAPALSVLQTFRR
ncbi:hypothetical protein [Streptomyces sp. NPDC002328]|uniref:hypothetical protein n=1 Tax=Streptomyces sp. NPDC002328 TaxID=3364642 RepID=UPI0036A11957